RAWTTVAVVQARENPGARRPGGRNRSVPGAVQGGMTPLFTLPSRPRRPAADRAGLRAATRRLTPLIASFADQIEELRGLPPLLFDELVAAGLFHMLTPRVYGGSEMDPGTVLQVVEEVAKVDGSTAWLLMINNNGGLVTAYL